MWGNLVRTSIACTIQVLGALSRGWWIQGRICAYHQVGSRQGRSWDTRHSWLARMFRAYGNLVLEGGFGLKVALGG